MEGKHTPGPWDWNTESRDKDRLVSASGRTVLVPVVGWDRSDIGIRTGVWGVKNEGEEEARANARIIAAAPDLLAALEITDAAMRTHPGGDCRDVRDIDKAHAAIAKAKGA